MAHHWFSQQHLIFARNFTMGEEEESPLIDSVLCAFHSAKRSPGIQSAQAPWKEEFLLCQLYATSITTTIPPLSYQPYHFLNSFS